MKEIIKIVKINAENIKAISQFSAFFGGKSAHITGKNKRGKSTAIRVLIDKLQGLEPAKVTKIGEQNGRYEMHLTDGSRFEWKFGENGYEKIDYYPGGALKPAKREVFRSICKQYFVNQFDIQKFLTTSEPRKRLQMISELINIDLTDVNNRYKEVYAARRDAKKELKILVSQRIHIPAKADFSKLDNYTEAEKKKIENIKENIKMQDSVIQNEKDRLNALYVENKANNEKKQAEYEAEKQEKLKNWELENNREREKIESFNEIQKSKLFLINDYKDELQRIEKEIDLLSDCFDFEKAKKIIDQQLKPEPEKKFVPVPMPEFEPLDLPDAMPDNSGLQRLESEKEMLLQKLYIAEKTLKEKESELNDLKVKKQVYESKLSNYRAFQSKVADQELEVQNCEEKVNEVLQEIKDLVSSAKIPDEFSIDLTEKNDILFREDENSEYLPITNETLASSAIYIAAFKLHAYNVDVFRVVHFDVSYLDYENRKKVLEEAKKMNIQLLTESPATCESESELQYEITEG
ncbi:MAG: hypothetical protein GF317_23345 [Candidatus Lokiarchaeota archaeon]|nr:hypothetical protein [Candidatus Lokiarchaeota archaeon]